MTGEREPRIMVLRRIVARHQHEQMEGVLMDGVTAQMLVAVYERLGPEARLRFDDPPLARLVEFGWKQVTIGRGSDVA